MLYLIRHGETSANQAGLYAGLAEYELTSNGQAQAKNIGDFVTSQLLNGLCIDEIIISSPSNRARITAKIIANYFNGTRVVIDDRINEVDYGKLDGTPIRKGISFVDEAQRENGGLYGVEPIADIKRRAHHFIVDNAEHLDPQSTKIKLAVGHGALWSVIYNLVQSRPLSKVKLQKNYEVISLTTASTSIIDTRK